MIPGHRAESAVALWLVAVTLAVAIPGGGASAGGQLAARLAAFTGLALAVLAYGGRPPARRLAIPIAALAALGSLGLAQSGGWPPVVARVVSPAHGELSTRAAELLSDEGAAATGAVALSLAPELSRSAAIAVLAVAAVYWAAYVAGGRRRHRRWLALALVAAGLSQVVGGLRDWLAGEAPRLRGTFVNPNHLAYALAIALAVAFAWAAWSGHRQRYAASMERRLLLVAPPVLAWTVLAAALLATGSRAGLAAAATGLLVQFWLLPVAAPALRRGAGLRVLGMAAAAALVALAARGSSRLGDTTLYELSSGHRPTVWRHCLELWRRFPVTGTGLGSFGESFPLVQPRETTDLFWQRAHNDPLELLVTGGLVGLALGIVAAAGATVPIVRALRSGSRGEDRAAGLAGVGAMVSVGVHELMDFGLTLPGIALPLAVLVGAASAVRIRRRSRAAVRSPGAAADGRMDRSRAGASGPAPPPPPAAPGARQ